MAWSKNDQKKLKKEKKNPRRPEFQYEHGHVRWQTPSASLGNHRRETRKMRWVNRTPGPYIFSENRREGEAAGGKSVEKLPEAAERGQRPQGRNGMIKDDQWFQVPAAPNSEGTRKSSFPHRRGSLSSVKACPFFSTREKWRRGIRVWGTFGRSSTHTFHISRKQSTYLAAEKGGILELWDLEVEWNLHLLPHWYLLQIAGL